MSEQSEKEDARQRIAELAEKYRKDIAEGKRGLFTEQDVGSKFIMPLLEALGWDTKNIDEVREQRRTLTGPADYFLNISKVPEPVVEIKKFDEDLDAKRNIKGRLESHPEQAIRYALHLRCDWVVLTKFEETRLYFTYAPPEKGLVFALKFDDYLKPVSFEKLWLISKASVSTGRLARLEKKRERKDIDEQIVEDLLVGRRLLATSVAQNNRSVPPLAIREAVQRILDRTIVVRTA